MIVRLHPLAMFAMGTFDGAAAGPPGAAAGIAVRASAILILAAAALLLVATLVARAGPWALALALAGFAALPTFAAFT